MWSGSGFAKYATLNPDITLITEITGWSILFLYTLNSLYDNNNSCTIKIVVELFSVYPDISFDNKKSEEITGISFYNRNNRNNKDNRNNIQKMFKMVSFFAEHNVGLFV